jgi:glycolate oxidase
VSGRPARATPETVEALARVLRTELGEEAVRSDPATLEAYARDESDAGVFPPQLVVFPTSTAQVSSVFRRCQEHRVPFTPCGARSGKSGGSLPVLGGVAVSLERMNRLLCVSAEDLVAVVQPGLVTGELMRQVEARGLFYPPDPASLDWCTIGGNVAENAGGPRALKYGVTRDYVLGLEWVLPSGEVVRVGKRTIKGVAGYDLVGLFVGSEGTLGVATEVTLQLLPLPRVVRTALLSFPSVEHAARAVSAVLAAGILPRTLELLDDVALRAVDGRTFHFPPGAGACVIAEVDGNVEEGVLAELAALGEVGTAQGAVEVLVAQSEAQREGLWAARRGVSPGLRALKRHKVSDDIVVPRSRMAEVIGRLKDIGAELGLTVATYGHAGDGNLHANVLYDGPHEWPRVEEALARMLRLTVEVGGTITGEHGVGLAKKKFLPLEQPAPLLALQRQVKALLDPAGLLNPAKIFDDAGC